MRVAVKIGYDGSRFHGFAMQPGKHTVEGEILERLKKTRAIRERNEAQFQYASRTDRGVHALGNVIAFNCSGDARKILGDMEDIWVFGTAVVDDTFNPRHCISKTYRYYVPGKGLDCEKMVQAAALFMGEHDFSGFARLDERNPIRTVKNMTVKNRGEVITIDVEGKSFLWNQVRRMVAALIKVGKGENPIDDIREVLQAKKRVNFGVAPAENLVLLDVKYDFAFEIDIPDRINIKRMFFTDASQIHRNR